jgi:hypothetical protein
MFRARAGGIPWGPSSDEQLVPLTRIEENLVSRYRVHRNLYVMKPAVWSWSAAGTLQLCHRAHVIATPNTGPDLVRDCLLEHPSCLADSLQVVFLVLVDSDSPETIAAAVKKMVDKSPALRIRGREVLKWAIHLSKVRCSDRFLCDCRRVVTLLRRCCSQVYGLDPPSEDIAQAYRNLDTLPESVVATTVVARTATDAALLVRTYLGPDRVGPANVHGNNPDALFEQAMEGPDARPPVPEAMLGTHTPMSGE